MDKQVEKERRAFWRQVYVEGIKLAPHATKRFPDHALKDLADTALNDFDEKFKLEE
jgi:hypothetical protein